jgi:hypothetical protein
MLDATAPYGISGASETGIYTLTTTNSGTLSRTFSEDDSPGKGLGASYLNGISIQEQFKMYLMYTPQGGIPVAIGMVRWGWQASAAKVSESTWCNPPKQVANNPQISAAQPDTPTPQWGFNAKYLFYKPAVSPNNANLVQQLCP